jgi:hypothetical protein
MSAETIAETLAIVAAGEKRYGLIDGPRAKPVNLHHPAVRKLWSWRPDKDAPQCESIKSRTKQQQAELVTRAVELHASGAPRFEIGQKLGVTAEQAGRLLRRGGVILRQAGISTEIVELAARYKTKPHGMSCHMWCMENGVPYNRGQYVQNMIKLGKL